MPEGKRPLGRPRHRWEDNIKWFLEKSGLVMWIGFIWFRIGTGGGLVNVLFSVLSASQEGICSKELVN
jgi:hypothetical protein